MQSSVGKNAFGPKKASMRPLQGGSFSNDVFFEIAKGSWGGNLDRSDIVSGKGKGSLHMAFRVSSKEKCHKSHAISTNSDLLHSQHSRLKTSESSASLSALGGCQGLSDLKKEGEREREGEAETKREREGTEAKQKRYMMLTTA